MQLLNRSTWACWSLGITAALAIASAGTGAIIYVDDDAEPGGDGLSWISAHRHLQDGLAHAALLTPPVEIRVAQGIYEPDRNEAIPEGTGNRQATFQLLSEVMLFGGFAGIGAEDPDARDLELYVSTLSGDLLGDDPEPPHDFTTYADNSWHVVTGSGVDDTAVLEGFTITGGFANGPLFPAGFDAMGAGMLNDAGSPTVRACTFAWNRALDNGAGMANLSASPFVAACEFERNLVDFNAGPGGGGGGLLNAMGGEPYIVNCTFSDNEAEFAAGLQNFQCDAIVLRCTFTNNAAVGHNAGGLGNGESNSLIIGCTFTGNTGLFGGGLHCSGSAPLIMNCLFVGNSAQSGGGAMGFYDSEPVVTNCTMVDNVAVTGAGIDNTSPNHLTVANSILWNPAAEEISHFGGGSTATVTYSDVRGGHVGEGNISVDPQWRALGDLRLRSGSPCIDAGDNTAVPTDELDLDGDGDMAEPIPLDLAGLPRFVDDPETIDTGNPDGIHSLVDMGAYEFCRADAVGDGVIDVSDLVAVITAWGSEDMDADTNADGIVDVQDLLAVIVNWGPCM